MLQPGKRPTNYAWKEAYLCLERGLLMPGKRRNHACIEQVSKFLGTQSRPAVEQMIAFITDDSNKKAFGKSGRRLAGTASRSIFRHLKVFYEAEENGKGR